MPLLRLVSLDFCDASEGCFNVPPVSCEEQTVLKFRVMQDVCIASYVRLYDTDSCGK